ncbi:MAG: hypothetical protein RMY62_002765 [Nostoc sp. ZfuVER08]|uniref:Uncharacterized protein n=1 Tax=Nostoc punctiforme FACHB-252 TaxID=1357509 RepID=A0ABR8HHP3_NOSPU|nr:hypothetical protein [Nostoc punctiforme]MBD2615038.1 hypothetical protein [Nostoc punctiforme FACHB-252]MBL1201712.1 hypothetical protein [Nostoc sp. GBBB01]MDZ8012292.1 hypothetical protein [Nostoc sp. ZfuVER08]
MKLDSHRPDVAVQARRRNLQGLQQLRVSGWVKLLELPNPWSFDEALLLCPVSKDEWLAWIPDHGEAILNIKQFSY